jgi:hypothetical protein
MFKVCSATILLAVIALITACKTKPPQPSVMAMVECSSNEFEQDPQGCRVALQTFLQTNPTLRISGVSPYFSGDEHKQGGTSKLFVWSTDDSSMPAAKDILIDNVPCTDIALPPEYHSAPVIHQPDCATPLDDFYQSNPSHRIVYNVPLFDGKRRMTASVFVLYLTTTDSQRTVEHPKLFEVVCKPEGKLEFRPGKVWFNEARLGVIYAKPLFWDLELGEPPEGCECGLIDFLRGHLGLRVADVFALYQHRNVGQIGEPIRVQADVEKLLVVTTSNEAYPIATALSVVDGTWTPFEEEFKHCEWCVQPSVFGKILLTGIVWPDPNNVHAVRHPGGILLISREPMLDYIDKHMND